MIFVECKADEKLVKILIRGYPIKIRHSGNKSGVIKRLIKDENNVGMIDEDPGKPIPKSFNEKFQLFKEYNEFNLKLFQEPKKNNLIVQICPRLEEWIIDACYKSRINLNEYKLPNDPMRLHSIINVHPNKIEKLLKTLKNSMQLKRLKKIFINFHS
ncbi:MAG: hypothetical protein ACTSRW_03060 [Candidatus Helarchaeota archaeon]